MANITTSMVDELRVNVSGTVAQPGESSYDEAVNIWNATCARRPAIVARCTSSDDVAAALDFALRQNLEVFGSRWRPQLCRRRALRRRAHD